MYRIFKRWGEKAATIKVNGKEGKVKQGLLRDTDGTFTLVVWLEKESTIPVSIDIS